MFAIASMYNLQVHQMDVKIVFLYGDREIYLNQPKGYIVKGHEHKHKVLIIFGIA